MNKSYNPDVYAEGELVVRATAEDFSVVQIEGSRKVRRNLKFYNLDAIISGIPAQDHFSHMGEMVTISSGAEHFISDYDFNLPRYACYTEDRSPVTKVRL